MRYIGSKAKVLSFILNSILSKEPDIKGKVFTDLFAGTGVVSKLFKSKGCIINSNDYMTFSYRLQIAHIKLNEQPKFENLNSLNIFSYKMVLNYLNSLNGKEGFFYKNYCLDGSKDQDFQRNYFSVENAKKIDAILGIIRKWKIDNLLSDDEESVLLANLIDASISVSNISGTYGAFLKNDDPRKHKKLLLIPIKFMNSDFKHNCYNKEANDLIPNLRGDILYLDPPYNHRQYPPYYHILETISLNDKPNIYGKTGRRPYKDKISNFCNKRKAGEALESVIKNANFKHIFLSYNSEGILNEDRIKKIMDKYGQVDVFYEKQRRYKSNSNGNHNGVNKLRELLFYVRKEE